MLLFFEKQSKYKWDARNKYPKMVAQTAFFKHLTCGTRDWWIFSSVTGSRCSLAAQIRKRLFINWRRAGCQAPEVLRAVISARKNNAIANKFTWPSSASRGQAGECLSEPRQQPHDISPENTGGKRKMLTDYFKDFFLTVSGPLGGQC